MESELEVLTGSHIPAWAGTIAPGRQHSGNKMEWKVCFVKVGMLYACMEGRAE